MLTVGILKQFLEDENLDYKEKSEKQLAIHSPFTDDDKFRCAIGLRKSDWFFNDFIADARLGTADKKYKGHFWYFLKLYKNFKSVNEAKRWFVQAYIGFKFGEVTGKIKPPEEKPKVKFDGFERLNKNKHPDYYKYLTDRGLTNTVISRNKIFVNEAQRRVCFPTYRNGQMIAHNSRAIYNHPIRWLKSKGQSIFPVWNLDNADVNCYIFEGIMDAICINNGVAIMTAQFSDDVAKQILNKNFSKIVVVMDNDVAGNNARLKIAKALSLHHNNIFIYDWKGIKEKDFNEMLINGTDFDMDNRIKKWTKSMEINIKLEELI